MDFTNLAYLQTGNARQQADYQLLDELQLFTWLADYQPILTGTFPLTIDIDSSDLDICCEVYELEQFAHRVEKYYGHLEEFKCRPSTHQSVSTAIISFKYQGWPIEVFGQALPTQRQYAYRHMLIEYRVLSLANAHFKENIIQLKQDGAKTEPAFSQLLGLPGDPYETLLNLEQYSQEQLCQLLNVREYLK
ncbi:MAG: DUF4269 domain-containing protein [Bacteroidota bacterium]